MNLVKNVIREGAQFQMADKSASVDDLRQVSADFVAQVQVLLGKLEQARSLIGDGNPKPPENDAALSEAIDAVRGVYSILEQFLNAQEEPNRRG